MLLSLAQQALLTADSTSQQLNAQSMAKSLDIIAPLQDIRGHDIFSDSTSESRPSAGAVPGLSDAKKKALYSTSVFDQNGPAAAPQVTLLMPLP